MPNEPIVVEPRASAGAPVPEAAPAPAPAGDQSSGLPDEVLQIPALQGLFAGAPVAISASLSNFAKRPEGQLIAKNTKPLQEHGIGLYRALDGDTGVLFNQLKISGEQIKQADAAGKLAELAPPFDSVNASVGASGAANPALSAAPPIGAAGAPPPVPPQAAQAPMAGGKPPSAAVQKKITTARLENQKPGSPTSGPKPGSGRLLNQILKPVV